MAEINSTAQVTSALTGVSDVLTPVFTLWYLQKNITSDIAPYVTRVTWSDNIKNESDTIEVELDDTDGQYPRSEERFSRNAAGWINGIRARVTR
mgnify:CR=1 FL=1